LYKEGYTKKQIVTMLKTTYKRVRKYLNGNPENLCITERKNNRRGSKLERHKATIEQMLSEGKQYKEMLSILKSEGYAGGYSILCEYCSSLKNPTGSKLEKMKVDRKFINRRDIFKYIWSQKEIDENDKETVYARHPELVSIDKCVKDFRKIFEHKSLEMLHEFIEKYKRCNIRDFCSFANGLKNDLAAVENSVVSQYSNGILEGNNNRLKLIKRTMYGRAKLPLLRAKVLTPAFYKREYTQICG
jgi:hypothetical protein